MDDRSFETRSRSFPEIFTDLFNQTTTLLSKEGQLARAEMSEKMSQVAVGIALLLFGAVLLIPALVILLDAGVAALVRRGFEAPAAALIVGGSALALGVILALIGLSRLKAKRLRPTRTIDQLQQDAAVAKQQMRSDHEQIHRAA
jgi:membrane protein implicated in regulation of membrane protease activity